MVMYFRDHELVILGWLDPKQWPWSLPLGAPQHSDRQQTQQRIRGCDDAEASGACVLFSGIVPSYCRIFLVGRDDHVSNVFRVAAMVLSLRISW